MRLLILILNVLKKVLIAYVPGIFPGKSQTEEFRIKIFVLDQYFSNLQNFMIF